MSVNYLLLQQVPPPHLQNRVQLRPFALHVHLFVAHGVSEEHPHFTTFSSSSGASGVSNGTIVG